MDIVPFLLEPEPPEPADSDDGTRTVDDFAVPAAARKKQPVVAKTDPDVLPPSEEDVVLQQRRPPAPPPPIPEPPPAPPMKLTGNRKRAEVPKPVEQLDVLFPDFDDNVEWEELPLTPTPARREPPSTVEEQPAVVLPQLEPPRAPRPASDPTFADSQPLLLDPEPQQLIRFRCPRCNKKLKATPDKGGRKGRCKCGRLLYIPQSPG